MAAADSNGRLFVNASRWRKAHSEQVKAIERALRRGLLMLGIAHAWLAPLALLAQSERTIPDNVNCAACSIETTDVAVLGSASGPDRSVDRIPISVFVDGVGRYWLFGISNLPILCAPSGDFIRFVGTRGEGPGEFVRAVDAVRLPGDSILVFDAQLRATLLAPDLSFVRSVPTTFLSRPNLAVRWPSNVWMQGFVPTAEGVGWPLHRVSFAGDQAVITRSFGPGSGEATGDRGMSEWLWIAEGDSSTVWTADRFTYRLVQWTEAGTRIQTLRRSPQWFDGRSTPWTANPATPPPPAVMALSRDQEGRLWTFVHVAAPGWREALADLAPLSATGGGVVDSPRRQIAVDNAWQTLIEVIDPATARVVARRTLHAYVIAALPGQRAVTVETLEDGRYRVTVLALKLVGLPEQRSKDVDVGHAHADR